jgi:hypothetical protein
LPSVIIVGRTGNLRSPCTGKTSKDQLGSAKKSLSWLQVNGEVLAAGFSADPEPVASAIPLSDSFDDPYAS